MPDMFNRITGTAIAFLLLGLEWIDEKARAHPKWALAILAVVVLAVIWLIVDLWSAVVLAVLAGVGWGAWRLLVAAERS